MGPRTNGKEDTPLLTTAWALRVVMPRLLTTLDKSLRLRPKHPLGALSHCSPRFGHFLLSRLACSQRDAVHHCAKNAVRFAHLFFRLRGSLRRCSQRLGRFFLAWTRCGNSSGGWYHRKSGLSSIKIAPAANLICSRRLVQCPGSFQNTSIGRDGHHLPGDHFPALAQGAHHSLFQSAAAGDLHTRHGDAFDVIFL